MEVDGVRPETTLEKDMMGWGYEDMKSSCIWKGCAGSEHGGRILSGQLANSFT